MAKYYLAIALVVILGLLFLAYAPLLSADRSIEQEILAQEGVILTGLASAGNSSGIAFTSCTDNDGYKPSYPGKVVARYIYKSRPGTIGHTDTCRNDHKVEEYICENNKPVLKVVSCAAGCKKGACQRVVECAGNGDCPAGTACQQQDGVKSYCQ